MNAKELFEKYDNPCEHCFWGGREEDTCDECYELNMWEPSVEEDPSANEMQKEIARVCLEVSDMLIKKNRSYGNSVADPVRIFSKMNPIDQINVRIDDKLSRLMHGKEYAGDDTEFDLVGYLILKRVLLNMENRVAKEE